MRLHPIRSSAADEAGVTAIEYALIAALIAMVVVGAVGLVGTRTQALFTLVSNCVTFATTGAGSCP